LNEVLPNRFINTLEILAKSDNLHQGNIDVVAREILSCSAEVLGTERVNAWLFNHYGNALECLQCFTQSENTFKSENSLSKTDFPNYFEYLKRNEVIIANNAETEPINEELLETYIQPLNITAMVDIPLRSQGKIIGVICFEHCGYLHDWTDEEIKFMQSVAQLLSLALETKEKLETQAKLERALEEKDEVLRLFFERIDNNVQNLLGLINFQKYKCKDDYHMDLMEEIKSKLMVMTMLQDKLQQDKTPKQVDIAPFLSDLVSSVKVTFGMETPVELKLELESATIPVPKAIPLGLIIHEILTNTFRTAFGIDNRSPELSISCSKDDNETTIVIYDNGHASVEERNLEVSKDIIEGLVEQIEGEIAYSFNGGMRTEIRL
jgi:two-component sensor histidine kinase